MKNLATMWTEHISDADKKAEFVKLMRNSTLSLGRLRDIIRKLQTELLRSERSVKTYDNRNWTYLQAHTNGMLQAYGNVDRLLSFMDKE